MFGIHARGKFIKGEIFPKVVKLFKGKVLLNTLKFCKIRHRVQINKVNFSLPGRCLSAILPSSRPSRHQTQGTIPAARGKHEDHSRRNQGPLLLPALLVHAVLRGRAERCSTNEAVVGGVS